MFSPVVQMKRDMNRFSDSPRVTQKVSQLGSEPSPACLKAHAVARIFCYFFSCTEDCGHPPPHIHRLLPAQNAHSGLIPSPLCGLAPEPMPFSMPWGNAFPGHRMCFGQVLLNRCPAHPHAARAQSGQVRGGPDPHRHSRRERPAPTSWLA